MVTTTRIRLLRLKYGVPLMELSRITGVSWQRLSRLELGKVHATSYQEKRVADAIEEYLVRTRAELEDLELYFLIYKGRLFEMVEVENEP